MLSEEAISNVIQRVRHASMFLMMAAVLALGVASGVVSGTLFVRGLRAVGPRRILWALPISLTGILLARAHFLLTSTISEPVRWARFLILFLGGATAFFWTKNKWQSSR